MRTYNKIMLYFWLVVAIVVFLFITFKSVTDGAQKWAPYYVFVGTALLMFFVKRWMMKRMEKHLDYLEEKNNK